MRSILRHPSPAAVFALALSVRLFFCCVINEPLLYTHQYTYFTNALWLAQSPQMLHEILHNDDWRLWDKHWTIAPLYYVFAALVFRVFGPHLLPLRILQAGLDSVCAVAVALIGKRLAGPRGVWAGVVYALYWPAIEMSSWTLTENLHTVLLVLGIAVATREDAAHARRDDVAAGVLLGLSALARSVSSGFLGLTALSRVLRAPRRWRSAALLLGSGLLVILPWTARNVFYLHEPVMIESAAFENLWWANHFTDLTRFRRQQDYVFSRDTPSEKRKAAFYFASRGIRRRPDLFAEKVALNFRHILRPEGLHNWILVQRSIKPWRHAANLLLDDVPLLLCVPLFAIFVVAGRPSRTRTLMLTWCGYYLFMIVVVFHNEIRYRSALVPFVFAGALGVTWSAWRALPRWRRVVSLAFGAALVAVMLRPYVRPAARLFIAYTRLRPALRSIDAGNIEEAMRLGVAAAQADPTSARPWFDLGRRLARTSHVAEAIQAYQQGAPLATLANWRAVVALPRLLQESGSEDEARAALRRTDQTSWNDDPWLVLEAAWRELPPPRTDTITLGVADYGAVRGFLHPRGGDPQLSAHRLEWNKYPGADGNVPPPGPHRWTRRHAWLRLVPVLPARSYRVTLEMGSPFPSTLPSADVRVTANGRGARFRLDRAIRAYTMDVPAREDRQMIVRLDAPTWNRAGEPAEQGVRVDRMTVSPVP